MREVRGLYATDRSNFPLLAQRRADLARIQAELARSEATLAPESELKRREALAKRNFVSAENVQLAQTVRDAARAQRDAAARAVKAGSAAIAQTEDQATVSRARVDNTSPDHFRRANAVARYPDLVGKAAVRREP